jgi:hypothetical protein
MWSSSTVRKIAGEPRAYDYLVCLRVSVKQQQDISVLRIRLLFHCLGSPRCRDDPPPFIADRAVIGETESELFHILRFLSIQVPSDWFGYIEFHWDYFVRLPYFYHKRRRRKCHTWDDRLITSLGRLGSKDISGGN